MASAAGPATASPEEIARFSAMADEWWDPEGKFKPLHRFNPARLDYMRDKLAAHFGRDAGVERPLEGLRVLDIGCGGGLVAEPMAAWGASVVAIDASEKNIRIAALHAERSGLAIAYRHALPEDLARDGLSFDAVLNLEVIEHVPDVTRYMTVAGALVRPGGAMVLATLSRTLKSFLLAKVGAEYVLRWLPAGTHEWNRFVKPSELKRLIERAGMSLVDLVGMSYNPLSDTWSLSRDLDVNYLAFAVKS